jgi:hypothetical protein
VADFLAILERVNRRLDAEDSEAEWLLVGGALRAMLLDRQETLEDIDVVLKLPVAYTPQETALRDYAAERAVTLLRGELGLSAEDSKGPSFGLWRGIDVEYPGPIYDKARLDLDDPSFNTLYLHPDGRVLDKHGGAEDLRRKVLRWLPTHPGQKPSLYSLLRCTAIKNKRRCASSGPTARATCRNFSPATASPPP